MKPDWAELYDEHVATYYERDGQCQNPHCGHRPIHLRHVLRHKYSGESLEIGHICFLRWQKFHGISSAELEEYEVKLQEALEWTSAGAITGAEYSERRVQAIHERRRKHYIKQVQQKNPVRIDKPLSHFSSEKEAEEYAEKHEGYCSGMVTMSGVKYWCLYIPKENTKKVYVCPRCGTVYSIRDYEHRRFCKCGSFLKARYIVRE